MLTTLEILALVSFILAMFFWIIFSIIGNRAPKKIHGTLTIMEGEEGIPCWSFKFDDPDIYRELENMEYATFKIETANYKEFIKKVKGEGDGIH